MNLIDERNTRTIYRKLRKKEFDGKMDLSVRKGERVRLLDEGVVVDGGGNPLFYIKKGTLSKYYENLPDDFVGTINLGHMDFATFPFILGEWTKKDLHLVDIGEGRQALDVDLRFDERSILVKELRRLDYTIGVSSEFTYHEDKELTEKYGLQILDSLFIDAFGIVGEAGNVNSSNIRLKGGENMTIQELSAAIDGEQTNLEEINLKLDELLADGESSVDTPEAPQSEEPEEVEAEPAAEEETAEEATEEPTEDLAAVELAIEKMQKENEELRAELDALKAQLSAKLQAEREFVSKFKNLSVSLNVKPEVTEEPVIDVFTDGIGA